MDNRKKEKNMAKPIEQHDTAAWANIEKQQQISNVAIPSLNEVRNAKDWVDANQK